MSEMFAFFITKCENAEDITENNIDNIGPGYFDREPMPGEETDIDCGTLGIRCYRVIKVIAGSPRKVVLFEINKQITEA